MHWYEFIEDKNNFAQFMKYLEYDFATEVKKLFTLFFTYFFTLILTLNDICV